MGDKHVDGATEQNQGAEPVQICNQLSFLPEIISFPTIRHSWPRPHPLSSDQSGTNGFEKEAFQRLAAKPSNGEMFGWKRERRCLEVPSARLGRDH